jgi:hypothetical protein
LAGVLAAKRLTVRFVRATPSLVMALASRAGREEGPFLRTPEGFVLSELRTMLDWLERAHPRPAMLPPGPVRRVSARLLEGWIDYGLARSSAPEWDPLARLEAHLEATGFLLGPRPQRPDWMLAAWLEADVFADGTTRGRIEERCPALGSIGERLLNPSIHGAEAADDALPVSLLDVFECMAAGYGADLERNHAALKDPGVEPGWAGAPRSDMERSRVAIGRELAALDRGARRRVSEFFEPLGLWHLLSLPPAIEEIDPGDPRSL